MRKRKRDREIEREKEREIKKEKKTKDTFFYARRFSIIGSFIRIKLTNTRKARAFYGMLNIELISLKQPWPYSAYIEVGGFWPPSPLIPL